MLCGRIGEPRPLLATRKAFILSLKTRLMDFWNRLEDSWSSMFVPGASVTLWNPGYNTNYSSNWDCSTATKRNGSCHVPTVIENYGEFSGFSILPRSTQLLTATGYVFGSTARGVDGQYRPSERNATLAKLQIAHSEATAIMMWSAARSGPFTSNLRFQSLTNGTGVTSNFIGSPRQGQTMVTEYVLTGQLQVSRGLCREMLVMMKSCPISSILMPSFSAVSRHYSCSSSSPSSFFQKDQKDTRVSYTRASPRPCRASVC